MQGRQGRIVWVRGKPLRCSLDSRRKQRNGSGELLRSRSSYEEYYLLKSPDCSADSQQ